MAELYEYRTAGRSTLTLTGLAVALTTVLIAARSGAGPVIWLVWGLVTLAIAHHLLRRPVAGCRIDGAALTTFVDRKRRAIPLCEVKGVILSDCSGGRCTCMVELADGTALRLPRDCLPPAATLARKLRRAGLRVTIDRGKQRSPYKSLRNPLSD
ncbi:MAG: hypothetical protein QNJ16_00710 [Rhodobacter sp.]|nr:hypothetical protein [Rhodobacter sp.]